ncbi:hypothetical protein FH966_10465 [Lentibacillus cibarius]|uniref:DUF1648 domain-containing protein n=1 Tax=Lentibacillus cibarius TaxID=2583219 RepID=A0A549YJM5_9BACI|nr:hypothetical protein [Lentibacillus cibarius]TMN23284.1 hypothetical protein FFL34_15195 [Lentibacillus cibarius]TRM12071.1 hypothetical protein FH966_10465 [Lentibacillus cibarius]
MNDKLWKTIQISSFILILALIIMTIIVSPLEPLPGGGWEITFPSKAYQIIGIVVIIALGLTWVFATYVRKEGEVSMKAVKSGLFFIVGFGLFYLLLQIINS